MGEKTLIKMLQEILQEISEVKKHILNIERFLKINEEIDEPTRALILSRSSECRNGKAIEFSLDWNIDL